MNEAELFKLATDQFGMFVNQVQEGQWQLPTPDVDWDVSALVNHIVGEDLWVVPLMSGQTIAQVGDKFGGNVLGEHPAEDYGLAATAAANAFSEPNALDRTVHLSFGDTLAREYATQMLIDHLIHAWDLARAIGADERLNPKLVEAVYPELLKQAPSWRSSGAFGPEINLPEGADIQTKMLALTGRQV